MLEQQEGGSEKEEEHSWKDEEGYRRLMETNITFWMQSIKKAKFHNTVIYITVWKT